VDLLAFGRPHDKGEGMVLPDDGRTIAVSNDDDFGVTDDGNGHFVPKLLPSGAVDHHEVWFFRLNRSLHNARWVRAASPSPHPGEGEVQLLLP
jgi:hypothetical protein